MQSEQKEMVNSPIHTLASVPFQWEEKPGKPRPCTELITLPKSSFNEPTKCLEPPPRLYSPSPTTVLDGPCIDVKPKFSSSSFRFLRNLKGSFDSTETEQVSTFVLGKKKLHRGNWWQRNVKLKGAGNSCVFSSSFMDSTDYSGIIDKGRSCSARMPSFRSNGSLSSLSSKSHTWATIYEGFKQVIPWKSSKSKKEVFIV